MVSTRSQPLGSLAQSVPGGPALAPPGIESDCPPSPAASGVPPAPPERLEAPGPASECTWPPSSTPPAPPTPPVNPDFDSDVDLQERTKKQSSNARSRIRGSVPPPITASNRIGPA